MRAFSGNQLSRFGTAVRSCVVATVVVTLGVSTATAADPWADHVVSYAPGSNAQVGATDPQTALGEPERITGEGIGFAADVTPYNAPFESDEIVSVGAGGQLTVRFDEPIRNDAANPWGIDLIVFGNGFFGSDTPPTFDGPVTQVFGEGPFSVSVSANGVDFVPLGELFDDATLPMLGYSDVDGPYTLSGTVPTDFRKPVNPALSPASFVGKTFAEIVALYNGSGGGLGLDIASSGLNEISYVRIDVPGDSLSSPEFTAFSTVPEPAGGAALVIVALLVALRR